MSVDITYHLTKGNKCFGIKKFALILKVCPRTFAEFRAADRFFMGYCTVNVKSVSEHLNSNVKRSMFHILPCHSHSLTRSLTHSLFFSLALFLSLPFSRLSHFLFLYLFTFFFYTALSVFIRINITYFFGATCPRVGFITIRTFFFILLCFELYFSRRVDGCSLSPLRLTFSRSRKLPSWLAQKYRETSL